MKEKIKKVYKKLKGTFYLDKTQLPLIKQIVDFESSNNIDIKLDEIAEKLCENDDKWEKYSSELLKSIDILLYPKKITNTIPDKLITNFCSNKIKIVRLQYFFSACVEVHLLGILWILTIGYKIDSEDIDSCAYGNRLISLPIENSNTFNNSPRIFKSYFSQYSTWRDTAIKQAKNCLKQKENVCLAMFDFKSFYNSLDIKKEWFIGLSKNYHNIEIPSEAINRIHEFVFDVLLNYSGKLRKLIKELGDIELDIKDRVVLPIGYLPSNILSNIYMKGFDNAILTKFKPVFYGRYVDDIIIVDKINNNKNIQNLLQNFTAEDSAVEISASFIIGNNLIKKNENKDDVVCIDKIFDNNAKPELIFQKSKCQLFCLDYKAPYTVLDSFVKHLEKNSSEFRYLPDLDNMINKHDYSEIYNLLYQDTPNKLKFASNITLDKFSFSKFLGKYRKVGNLIVDRKEIQLLNDLTSIFDYKTLIENYTLWERMLEIMIVDDKLDTTDRYLTLVVKIIEAIKSCNNTVITNKNHNALWKVLECTIYRTISLCSGPKVIDIIERVNHYCKSFFKLKLEICHNFRLTRMTNNYVLPLPIDLFLDIDKTKSANCNFTHFQDVFSLLSNNKTNADIQYDYYPYVVKPQDIAYTKLCLDLISGHISSPLEQYKYIEEQYRKANGFCQNNVKQNKKSQIKIEPLSKFDVIHIESNRKNAFKIALGNAVLNDDDFTLALQNRPNRNLKRYNQLAQIIKTALKEKVDLLILPECYLPLEWLPDVAQLCAKNQIAIITGIEHVSTKTFSKLPQQCDTLVYNLTAIILPYLQEEYKYSYVTFHNKKHYSPNELEIIEGNHLNSYKDDNEKYQLFHWRDLWFTVYTCFELASIVDRSLFFSIVDLIVAVEWNKDTTYFNNIIESLSRDMHCYCVQVNSSNYGENRIVQPTHKNLSDIVKTKGGINSTVIIGEIDIKALHDFQCMKYNLQKQSGSFKPTPPGFCYNYVIAKQTGQLLELLGKIDKANKHLSE